jgi:hypothetical protein
MRSAIQASALFLGGLLTGAFVLWLLFKAEAVRPEIGVDLSHHHAMMRDCVGDVMRRLAPLEINAGLYERVWRLCGNQIFNGLYLDDFLIRRQKFVQQELDERVNLWLVVAITLSGVTLAGLQLFMSFRLAAQNRLDFAKDSQVTIETGKISLRSSITGVLILALSLAFFIIYVIYIYSIREVPLERPGNLQTPVEIEAAAPAPASPPPSAADTSNPAQGSKAAKTKGH